jgi:hypothetical protein
MLAGAALLYAAIAAGEGGAPAAPDLSDWVTICYNYGCHVTVTVDFTPGQLEVLQRMFAGVKDAEEERKVLGRAIGRMYFFAGEKTPIWRDHGLNYRDNGVDGKMDCIDHAHNTNEFLVLLKRHELLRFHNVHARLRRMQFVFADHWTARISDIGTGAEYAVDSWFFDPGEPAAVMPVKDWLGMKDPRG